MYFFGSQQETIQFSGLIVETSRIALGNPKIDSPQRERRREHTRATSPECQQLHRLRDRFSRWLISFVIMV